MKEPIIIILLVIMAIIVIALLLAYADLQRTETRSNTSTPYASWAA